MNNYNLHDIFALNPEKENALNTLFECYRELSDIDIISIGYDMRRCSMYIELENEIQIHYSVKKKILGKRKIEFILYDEHAETEKDFEKVFDTYDEAVHYPINYPHPVYLGPNGPKIF